jgi:hypothetical protein
MKRSVYLQPVLQQEEIRHKENGFVTQGLALKKYTIKSSRFSTRLYTPSGVFPA